MNEFSTGIEGNLKITKNYSDHCKGYLLDKNSGCDKDFFKSYGHIQLFLILSMKTY